jgi:hypothetical protein
MILQEVDDLIFSSLCPSLQRPPGGGGGDWFFCLPIWAQLNIRVRLTAKGLPPKREQQTNKQSTSLAYGPTQQDLEGCGTWAGPGRAKHVKYLERAGGAGSARVSGRWGELGVPLGN